MPFTGFILMHWSDKYLGLPYDKFNCAELVKFVYKKELNRELKYNFEMTDSLIGMVKLIDKNFFTFVEEEKLEEPEEFSIALMHGSKMVSHIGVATQINRRWYILHAVQNQKQTVRNRVNGIEMTGLRVEGFYKCLM